MTSVQNLPLRLNGSKSNGMKKTPVWFLYFIFAFTCTLCFRPAAYCQVKTKESTPAGPTSGVSFDLNQNNTNSTNIKYYLKNATEVSLKVYNLLGKEVATIINQKQHAGHHNIVYNGAGLSEGVYYYQIKIDGIIETKRIFVSK
jgi:hypothetical protein